MYTRGIMKMKFIGLMVFIGTMICMNFKVLDAKNLVTGASASIDTAKFKNTLKIDLKPEIAHSLLEAFKNKEFDSLIMFLESSLNFMIVDKPTNKIALEETISDYMTVEFLHTLLDNLEYERVNVKGGKNVLGEEVLFVSIFGKNEYIFPDIQFFFVLNQRQGINTLIVK